MHLAYINPGFVSQYAVNINPPHGSDWAKVLAAWNGSYTDLISVPSLGIVGYVPTVIALEKIGYFDVGDNLSVGSPPPYPGSVALAQLAVLDKDGVSADIWTPDPNGKLQMTKTHPSSQFLQDLVLAVMIVAATVITAGAAAGAAGAAVGETEGGVLGAEGGLDATGSIDGTALLDDSASNIVSFNDAANTITYADGSSITLPGDTASELSAGDINDAYSLTSSADPSGGEVPQGEGESPSGGEEDTQGAQSEGNTPGTSSDVSADPQQPLNTDISVPDSGSGLPTDISPQNLVKGLSTLLKIIGGGKVVGGQGSNVISNDSDYGQSGITTSGSIGGLFVIGLAAYLLYRER